MNTLVANEPMTRLNRTYSASVKVTSSGPPPIFHSHFELTGWGDAYRITCKTNDGEKKTRSFRNVSVPEVEQQFELLRNATICAYPSSPLVCDGEYVEVRIDGDFADLILGWWTIPPEGADAIADFSEWMRGRNDADEG